MLAHVGTDMGQIGVEKSLRRKLAEAFSFLWGAIGLGLSVVIANVIFRSDFHVTETILFGMIVYILIWIGGVLFFGFFTLFAPIKIVLVSEQDRTPGAS